MTPGASSAAFPSALFLAAALRGETSESAAGAGLQQRTERRRQGDPVGDASAPRSRGRSSA